MGLEFNPITGKLDVVIDEAEEISLDTSNFDGALSTSDDTVQKALDTLDDAIISSTIFGSEFQFVENLSVIVTTDDVTFITVLDFTTTNLPPGNYKIEWSYGWNCDGSGHSIHSRLALDNDFTQNNLIMEQLEEVAKDVSGATNRYIPTNTDKLNRNTGFRILNLSGIKNFKLDFRTTKIAEEASMWDATLILYRVS